MAEGHYIENRFSAMSQRHIVRLIWNLVEWGDRITHTSRKQNSKFRKFKMAHGHHFKNGLFLISQPLIIRFRWNLVYRCQSWFWECSRN